MDSAGAYSVGKRLLAEWLTKAERAWDANKRSTISFREQCDYYGKLGVQLPAKPYRVLFAASGSLPAAVKISTEEAIVEHALYWTGSDSAQEADYLCAVLNSETVRSRAAHWQAMGQWGLRHFDKAVFNLPIPLFNPRLAGHRKLAETAARAEAVAAAVPLKAGEHFTRTRRRIRAALIADGVAGEIERLVARLIGLAAAPSLAAGGEDD